MSDIDFDAHARRLSAAIGLEDDWGRDDACVKIADALRLASDAGVAAERERNRRELGGEK